MTRKEAEKLGYEYYYDDEEPFGCCKTDGVCATCNGIDCCSELAAGMIGEVFLEADDGTIWFEQAVQFNGTNLEEIKKLAPEANCSLAEIDESNMRISMKNLSNYIGEKCVVVEHDDFITIVPKGDYLVRQFASWAIGEDALEEDLLFHSYDAKDFASAKIHTLDSFAKIVKQYALEGYAKYAIQFACTEEVKDIFDKYKN